MTQIRNSILDCVGATPLIRLSRVFRKPGVEILAKHEGLNPLGSVKERVAVAHVQLRHECGIEPDRSNGAASRSTAIASNGELGPAPGITRRSRSALSAGWNADTIRQLKADLARKAERERELAENADLITARLAAMGASPPDVPTWTDYTTAGRIAFLTDARAIATGRLQMGGQ